LFLSFLIFFSRRIFFHGGFYPFFDLFRFARQEIKDFLAGTQGGAVQEINAQFFHQIHLLQDPLAGRRIRGEIADTNRYRAPHDGHVRQIHVIDGTTNHLCGYISSQYILLHTGVKLILLGQEVFNDGTAGCTHPLCFPIAHADEARDKLGIGGVVKHLRIVTFRTFGGKFHGLFTSTPPNDGWGGAPKRLALFF